MHGAKFMRTESDVFYDPTTWNKFSTWPHYVYSMNTVFLTLCSWHCVHCVPVLMHVIGFFLLFV